MKTKFDETEFLIERNITFLNDYSLKHNSYSKTGNTVKNFILPKSVDELVDVVRVFNKNRVEFKIIGETSNILFLDSVVYSNIICTKLLSKIEFTDKGVSVECGKLLPDFVRELSMRGYCGFEGLEGIPGTIGGGVLMNAGAYGYEISERLESVTYLDVNGFIKNAKKNELTFKRRSSFFKENPQCVILTVNFTTKLGDIEEIYKKIEKYHIARHKYQEWVLPNLGSIYSSERSIYDSSSKCKRYLLKLKVVRKIFQSNPIARHFNRIVPSNERLNKLFLSHFGMERFASLVSKKNLNTFTNRNNSTLEIMEYISSLKSYLDNDTYLENELVHTSIYEVLNEPEMNQTIKLYLQAIKKENEGE